MKKYFLVYSRIRNDKFKTRSTTVQKQEGPPHREWIYEEKRKERKKQTRSIKPERRQRAAGKRHKNRRQLILNCPAARQRVPGRRDKTKEVTKQSSPAPSPFPLPPTPSPPLLCPLALSSPRHKEAGFSLPFSAGAGALSIAITERGGWIAYGHSALFWAALRCLFSPSFLSYSLTQWLTLSFSPFFSPYLPPFLPHMTPPRHRPYDQTPFKMNPSI